MNTVSFEVLVSAMGLEDYRYIDTLNITGNCTVINQCNQDNHALINEGGRFIRFISTKERGLSRSRNMALNNAMSDICIFCDNDVEYVENYEEIILGEFQKHPNYDIIVFFIKRNTPDSKPYYTSKKRMGYLSTMKVFSPEIAFRIKSLNDKGIRFKTDFGAGSKYSMGEENIFLYDCLKKGLKILYVPIKIAELRYEESTWKVGYNEKYFRDKGTIFYEMSHVFCWLLNIQFVIRKRQLYQKEMAMTQALKYMFDGKRNYIETIRQSKESDGA